MMPTSCCRSAFRRSKLRLKDAAVLGSWSLTCSHALNCQAGAQSKIVSAIIEMPIVAAAKGLWGLVGFAKYLAKLMLHLFTPVWDIVVSAGQRYPLAIAA